MEADYHQEFIGIDEGGKQLLRGNTSSPTLRWRVDISGFPRTRSLQIIPGGLGLAGFEGGFFEFDLLNGEIIRSFINRRGVSWAHRAAGGRTLLGGINLAGGRGICLEQLDASLNHAGLTCMRGGYVRLFTMLGGEKASKPDGFLLAANRRILETDSDMQEIREYRARGFRHAWMARKLDDGDVLVSAGYGAFMARFAPDGALVTRFGDKKQMPANTRPFFYASFDIASDASVYVANWQGHGPSHGHKGRQLLHFAADGAYLQGWSWPAEISSLQGLILLN
jgi:hypothetical protein